MLGIAAAFKRLNRWHVNCGATYQWGALAISLYYVLSSSSSASGDSPGCPAVRYSCTRRTTVAPSPTAEATRLIDR
jgi:hypothetical protein